MDYVIHVVVKSHHVNVVHNLESLSGFMKIKIPIAAPIEYTTGVYVERALLQLGHDAMIIDQGETYKQHEDDADLFICADSGGPLVIPERIRHKACMWYIDSRRNMHSNVRNPSDLETAKELLDGGGLVFQSQHKDVLNFVSHFVDHEDKIFWLPLAADPEVWDSEPAVENKAHLLSFVGNCYDHERAGILGALSDDGLVYWPGIEKAVMQDGAMVYRDSVAGLNIPSWFGSPHCYDVNMRVFEILSCGIPLITNRLPDLEMLGMHEDVHVITYPTITTKENDGDTVSMTVGCIKNAYGKLFRSPSLVKLMGENARNYIIDNHTYVHRVQDILTYCEREGLI